MRALLAALVLSLAACTTPDPALTVRLLAADGKHRCSAVVVQPGVAITAKHCLGEDKLSVDGLAVSSEAPQEGTDVAVLTVPGLQCPCAEIGTQPRIGSKVKAIGFPGTLEGKRRTTDETTVKQITPASGIFSWLEGMEGEYIYTNRSILSPGDSGGGLFQRQWFSWKVIGINSHIISGNPFMLDPVTSGFAPIYK